MRLTLFLEIGKTRDSQISPKGVYTVHRCAGIGGSPQPGRPRGVCMLDPPYVHQAVFKNAFSNFHFFFLEERFSDLLRIGFETFSDSRRARGQRVLESSWNVSATNSRLFGGSSRISTSSSWNRRENLECGGGESLSATERVRRGSPHTRTD